MARMYCPFPARRIGWLGLLITLVFGCAAPDHSPGRPPLESHSPPPLQEVLITGATGPGIDYTACNVFLNGAMLPQTGWPLVLLDHFAPRPERLANLWVVQTRDCPQEMGSDPWPCLRVLQLDAQGQLVERDPRELLEQTLGRPVLVQVQGNLTTPDLALGGLFWTHTWLERFGALSPDTVLIAFDWPSQRVYRSEVLDVYEKAVRSFIGGYHLARFLQAFPPHSRICLLGQSYGGRVVASALHLLGGGTLSSTTPGTAVKLSELRPDLRLRAILIGASLDHDWLVPGERLGQALLACEALLNLYNRTDSLLLLYPLLVTGGDERALGRVGMQPADFPRLGPLAARYIEYDLSELIGRQHTLLCVVAHPAVAPWIAPYVWADGPHLSLPPPVPDPDLSGGVENPFKDGEHQLNEEDPEDFGDQ